MNRLGERWAAARYRVESLVHWPPRRDAVLRAVAGFGAARVVDVGAGPGMLAGGVARLGLQYLGIEPEAGMRAAAQARDARIVAGRAEEVGRWLEPGDVVVLNGVAHHLPDDALRACLAAARAAAGLIVCDHRREPGTPAMGRWLQAHDKGRFVRDYAAFGELPGFRLLRAERFEIPHPRLPLWPYFCNSYAPCPPSCRASSSSPPSSTKPS